jgi:hypothetical protein
LHLKADVPADVEAGVIISAPIRKFWKNKYPAQNLLPLQFSATVPAVNIKIVKMM